MLTDIEIAQKCNKEKITDIAKIKHGYTSKYYAKQKYKIYDEDVLNAAYNHVNCNSDKVLDRIIYIADKREPNRHIDDEIAEIAMKDINKAYDILKKDNAYEELLEENGTNLSGGQRQ